MQSEFVAVFLAFVATLLSPGSAFQRLESINRFHYGATFRHQGILFNDVDTWTHTFELQLPPLSFPLLPIRPCPNTTQFFCQFRNTLLSHLNDLTTNSSRDVQSTFNLIEHMLGRVKKPTVTNSRSKRALLPFVGDIANSLFGVATADDVKKLAAHVSKLYAMQLKTASGTVVNTGKISSYMKTSNQRMNNLMRTLSGVHERVLDLTRTLDEEDLQNRQTQQAILSLMPTLFSKLQQAIRLERKLELLVTGVTALMQRTLSPILVDHDTLAQTLQDIQSQLQQQHPDFSVVHKHPRYYYQSSKVLYAGQVEQILIILKVPISSFKTRFNLYHVLTFPVPFNESSNHATMVSNLPEYIAVSTDKNFLIEIPSSQMALCTGRHSIFCPDKFPHQPFSSPSCAKALIQKSGIQKDCEFEFQENAVKPSILELDEGTLLLTKIPEIIFTCHNVVTKKPGCSFCVVELPCFCSVLAGNFSFSPRLAACQDTSAVTVLPSPGINLALLQQFFNDTSVDEANADKMYLSKIPYSIPHLHIAKTDSFQDHAQKDKQLKIRLQDVVTHMKTGKKLYRSAMDAYMLLGDYDESSQWQLSHIIAYISFGLSLVLSVALLIMCQKLRTLLTVMAVAHAPIAKAAYPTLVWPNPNLPQSDSNPVENSDTDPSPFIFTPADHSIVSTQGFLCLLLIMVVILHLKLLFQSRHYSSKVMIEICTSSDRINVFLCSVAKCPGDYCISTSNWIRSLSVKNINRFWGELHINWPNLSLRDKRTGQEITLPLVVKLSLFERYKLSKMLKDDHVVFIKIDHGDTATYLRKPNSDPPSLTSPQAIELQTLRNTDPPPASLYPTAPLTSFQD